VHSVFVSVNVLVRGEEAIAQIATISNSAFHFNLFVDLKKYFMTHNFVQINLLFINVGVNGRLFLLL